MRTRRSASDAAARVSRKRTPASPSDSVSAMMCACDTGTRSAASKNSPTAIWCWMAQRRGSPASPASMAFSPSVRRMGGLPARHLDKTVRAQRRRVEDKAFEGLVAGGHDLMGQPFRNADHGAGPAATRRLVAERDIGLAFQDVDHLSLVDMIVTTRLAAGRDMPEDHLETGAEFAI